IEREIVVRALNSWNQEIGPAARMLGLSSEEDLAERIKTHQLVLGKALTPDAYLHQRYITHIWPNAWGSEKELGLGAKLERLQALRKETGDDHVEMALRLAITLTALKETIKLANDPTVMQIAHRIDQPTKIKSIERLSPAIVSLPQISSRVEPVRW